MSIQKAGFASSIGAGDKPAPAKDPLAPAVVPGPPPPSARAMPQDAERVVASVRDRKAERAESRSGAVEDSSPAPRSPSRRLQLPPDTEIGPAQFQADLRLFEQGASELSVSQQLQALTSLCVACDAPEMDPGRVEAVVQALCAMAQAHSPQDSRLLMAELGQQLGGPEMTHQMAVLIQERILGADLLPEQVGAMVLGLADALADPAPDAGTGPAAPGSSYLGPALAAVAGLPVPQLARWGLGCAVALRRDLERASEQLAIAVLDCGHLLSPDQRTALGCGMATGLGDGRVSQSVVDRLWRALTTSDAGLYEPFDHGVATAVDPLAGILLSDAPLERADWVYALPGLLGGGMARRQFDAICALELPARDRLDLLDVLLRHGASRLPAQAAREARSLALAHAPERLLSLYSAYVPAGLPPQVFADGPAQAADSGALRAAREALRERLVFVREEMVVLQASTAPGDRRAVLTLLGNFEAALAAALPAADGKSVAGGLSEPAGR